MDQFIKHMGENIFPQSFKELEKLFDFDVILSAAKNGLIQESHIQTGTSPGRMRPLKEYIELSEKGWEKYEELKPVENDNP